MPSPSSFSLNFLSLRSLVTILSLSAIVVAHPLWTLPGIYGETLVRRNGGLEKYLTDCEKPTSTCFSEHQYRSPELRTFHTDVKAYQTNQELQTTPAELTKYAEAYLKFLGKNTERNFIVAAVHKQETARVYLHSIPRESGYIAQLKVETPTFLKGYMSDYLTAEEAPYDIWHHAETAALTKALTGNGDADKTRDKYTDQYHCKTIEGGKTDW
ncbi:hypothetical protein BJ165DRAFT_1458765 [Panaeolus papilionaceus]|nr:hypothetical protein BJ165DRAFT_1458765 [Panaeolus papilionaceus]